MKTVTIIGFGRFGKTLYKLLKDDFVITLFRRSAFTKSEKTLLNKNTKIAKNLEEAYRSNVIFFAVPISSFENIVKRHKRFITDNHVLIDVLSVKVHPQKVLQKQLKNKKTQIILTHPMFGPDSTKDGFAHLPLIMHKEKVEKSTYNFWENFFQKKEITVIEMTPEKHDRLAARSQGLTHFVGRLLEKMDVKPTSIDSLGMKKLLEIKDQTCNDTWQLFHDLQTFNPYTNDMRVQLGKAYDALFNELLPKQIRKKIVTFGIQGGKGSFNEEALSAYVKKHTVAVFKTKYLFQTEKVLHALHVGDIDRGLFAISNSTGGLVEESIQAMGKYKFSIVEDFEIPIHYVLMKRKDANEKDIKIIMGHPQVFRQCALTLKRKFPQLRQVSGKGDLVDTAKAAEALAKGNIDKNIAILGPETLAKLYDLEIIERALEDKKDNITRFLLVKR